LDIGGWSSAATSARRPKSQVGLSESAEKPRSDGGFDNNAAVVFEIMRRIASAGRRLDHRK
jgi:hypothetical protein